MSNSLLLETGDALLLESASTDNLELEYPEFTGITQLKGIYDLGARMTEVSQDFKMWAGDHRNLQFTVTGSDGSGQDLTGTSIKWVLKESVDSASLILKQTSGSGITVSGSVMTVALVPADTTNLAGQYYHEAEVTDGAGNVSTTSVGTGTIEKSGV